MTAKNARNAVAAAIAPALALGASCAPALASPTPVAGAAEAPIVAQSSIVGADCAERQAAAWMGWPMADVDHLDTYVVCGALGYADHYEANISAWFTPDVYTVNVDAHTGTVL